MRAKDNAYCGYNVGEAEQYGLIKAIILNQIRWYLRTLGKQFDGQKCWRSVKDIADDIGIPYNTVSKYLPTEEMGIKHYSGYIPGTLKKTTWWEECSTDTRNPQMQKSDLVSYTKSKESVSYTKSYNNRRKKEENSLDFASQNQAEPFSSCPQKAEGKAEAVTPPDFGDVVDLKKAKQNAPVIDYKFANELLRAAGKKDKVGGRLIAQLRMLNKRYTKEELMEVARKSKFDSFWVKSPAISLFSEAGIGAMLNKDNKPEDHHPESHSTGIRREI